MKASKLIEELQKNIELAGDWEVKIETAHDYFDITQVFILDENEIGIQVW